MMDTRSTRGVDIPLYNTHRTGAVHLGAVYEPHEAEGQILRCMGHS
jgi:hypothetical protein